MAVIELILNLFSVSGGQATLSGNIWQNLSASPHSKSFKIRRGWGPFMVLNSLRLRKLVLSLRGLRLARVARLAKLVNMPLLQELANIVSGCLPPPDGTMTNDDKSIEK